MMGRIRSKIARISPLVDVFGTERLSLIPTLASEFQKKPRSCG